MKRDVLVTIKGLQYALSENDDQRVETINRGTFYTRNNKNYVVYEETLSEKEIVKSVLKFDDKLLELNKKGPFNVHMTFEEGKKNYTAYNTPYGDIMIGIDTTAVVCKRAADEINMAIEYDMEVNYEHLAKCRIDMNVKSI
ncbi:MAG: DUF1934 domain-containing protein [Lachnospiraceae bacterium]|nr:DUF1934 domain-containing protein [Lachnospiraceae bacterium]